MAIVIESFTVVVRLDSIQGRLSHPTFKIPNSTATFDDHLWKCGFMVESDARSFLRYLGQLGMKVEPGDDCEAVLVDEFEVEEAPPCSWLQVARWEKAVIAWKAGTEPDKVVAREGWDPKKGSGLTRESAGNMEHLEFLGVENGVEAYLNKETGQKVYVGRSKSPTEALFEKASEVIRNNLVNPGAEPLSGELAESVSAAVSELEQVLELDLGQWKALWFHGKGLLALGKTAEAYESFRKAFQLESNVEAIPRELAGTCLELGKFEEAVKAAKRAAELSPEDPGTMGNLALAQLMSGQLRDAKASSAKALALDPDDGINQVVRRMIDEVTAGVRPQPESMADLRGRPAKKKPFWKFW